MNPPVLYDAVYKPGFFKDVAKLPREVRARLEAAVEHIRRDPLSVASKRLIGHTNLHRYRLGDYRLVYYLDTKARRLLFLLIAHRKDIYRRMRRNPLP